MPEDVEVEHPEDGSHDDALEAVGAAGELRDLVGDLAHDERDAERHHQPREIGAAQDQKAGGEAEHGGAQAGHQERKHRLGHDAVLGQERAGIGAQTEERGMTQRYDPGIAENEVEREREQGEPGDLGEDQVPPGQQEHARHRRQPEDVFERAPARARREMVGYLVLDRRRHAALGATCRSRGRTGPADATAGR